LLAGRELERLRDHWIICPHIRVFGGGRHAHQGAEMEAARPKLDVAGRRPL
jgi:hypothetical protein